MIRSADCFRLRFGAWARYAICPTVATGAVNVNNYVPKGPKLEVFMERWIGTNLFDATPLIKALIGSLLRIASGSLLIIAQLTASALMYPSAAESNAWQNPEAECALPTLPVSMTCSGFKYRLPVK